MCEDDNTGFKLTLGIKGQGQIYNKLSNGLNSSYMFWWRMFIFGTIIVYDVYITTNVLDPLYDIGYKILELCMYGVSGKLS